jgi:hypothetical protein
MNWVSFRSEKFLDFNIVAFSFVFDNYCQTMNWPDLKESSHNFQRNCIISYFLIYI